MKKETILKKAIEKAVKNGFGDKLFWAKDLPEIEEHDEWAYDAWVIQLIFSHDFAEAFWGKEYVEVGIGSEKPVALQKAWRANLQKMVLEKDPIKYLGKFI